MSEDKITILTDLDPAGPVTHVRIQIPAPVVSDEERDPIRRIVREEFARALVRRNIGL